MVSTAKVSQFLEGLDFPVNKQQIIDFAMDNNAPQDVLDILRQMPEGRYFSMAGIWEAIGRVA